MRRISFFWLHCTLIGLLVLAGCRSDKDAANGSGPERQQPAFLQIGEFSINRISPERTEVRDGAGRTLVLIPRESAMPTDVRPSQVVRTPVQRVVAYGYTDIGVLRALGVLEQTLVGVTVPANQWLVPEVKGGMETGQIAYLGEASGVDLERLEQQKPDLVLSWNHTFIRRLDTLHIPAVVTATPQAMSLKARMRLIQFLGTLFHKEREAAAYLAQIDEALHDARTRATGVAHRPKVMWGDIYEKKVMVEPGNAWVGELIELAQGDYLFKDVMGATWIEITLERFLISGQDADIFFTYRTSEMGATSKEALIKLNPLIKDIRPLKQGKVYAPLPIYSQSADKLNEVITEISAILHPEVFPGYQLHYFVELPDADPRISKEEYSDHI